MKLEKLQPGMVVYDVHSYKMGNTTLSTIGTWSVHIVSIDHESRTCIASWNGNPPEKCFEHTISKWKATKPHLVRTALGAYRRPTREEIAAKREADKRSAATGEQQ